MKHRRLIDTASFTVYYITTLNSFIFEFKLSYILRAIYKQTRKLIIFVPIFLARYVIKSLLVVLRTVTELPSASPSPKFLACIKVVAIVKKQQHTSLHYYTGQQQKVFLDLIFFLKVIFLLINMMTFISLCVHVHKIIDVLYVSYSSPRTLAFLINILVFLSLAIFFWENQSARKFFGRMYKKYSSMALLISAQSHPYIALPILLLSLVVSDLNVVLVILFEIT